MPSYVSFNVVLASSMHRTVDHVVSQSSFMQFCFASLDASSPVCKCKDFFIPFFVPKWKNLDLGSYIQVVLTKERDTVPLGPGWGEELLFCLGMTDAILSEHYSLHE